MNNPLLPVTDALSQMLSRVEPSSQTESVALDKALGRVLAGDVVAGFSVPGFDNSAMDGYALRFTDLTEGAALTLCGEALAGHPYSGELPQGGCVRIMTGAVIPQGADTVVMQELALVDGNNVRFSAAPRQGDNVRLKGEDIQEGSTILKTGHRLQPADIGLLASLGQGQLKVHKRLKVAVISTGDELRLPGQPLAEGQLYDSNRFLIKAMLERFGADVLDLGLVADNPLQIEAAIKRAVAEADVLVTSAGMSVGSADHTRQILEKMGEIGFWKVAIKPGKPFAFGKLGDCWFFGLPGNPVAAAVTLDQLVQPVLKALTGELAAEAHGWQATTVDKLKKQPGRTDYQRGFFWQEDGRLMVRSTGNQNSGVLSSVAYANCYILLGKDAGSVEAGAGVVIAPFGSMLAS
ncbi:gephyrin-like molybdotransferase Glp [Gallaecimonas pentaromativorans]|uniref:Molybdopterin molybdenumtransferase n=1 Tax=Gallaecimonas pentaromativorans TaxID=584787 RepID=A0A3N1PSY0_9GAMM|nr:gephyrin-like molybdotransferase Glp [Gallaecimonas pentaromativorans]ROQ27646.1 molybdopterin molybdochelatase [Gallaecimonas pentaromativorans]